MNYDSKFLYDKRLHKNNSSFFSGENSSTLQSNIKYSFNKSRSNHNLKNIMNVKYLNSTIFSQPHKNKRWFKYSNITSSKNASKDNVNAQLYLTETKNVISPINKSKSRNKYINFINKKKNALPTLECFSYRNSEKFPEIFTCGDFKLKPKLLAELYYRQNNNQDKKNKEKTNEENNKIDNLNFINESKKNIIKQTVREYVYNANKRNFFNYCIKLKKEALDEYEKNMKSQIEGLNYTISRISNYKTNLENNYFIKYSEDKKEFAQEITVRKQKLDLLKNELLSLLKEVSSLSQAIIKKQTVKKNCEKWLSFLILLKEGSNPKNINIKEYVEEKYGKNQIFEKYSDFLMIFNEKEQNNIRQLKKNEKIIAEKYELKKELEDLTDNFKKNIIKNNINIQEKEKILNLLKMRNKDLNEIINNILIPKERNMKISKSSKNYNTHFGFIKQKYKDIDIEKDLKLNPLGVYCYNFDKVRNIHKMIYCIYNAILKNKIKGLDISYDTIYKINNIISKNKKAISQIKIIEFGLNYLNSSIKEKNKDKKEGQVIKEIKEQIDLYHKTQKAKLYEEERNQKISEFLNKMEEKSKKVYFIPHKKFENFPYELYHKKKNNSINKIKRKKLDIFDFLYDDESFSESIIEKKKK